jgi:cysteine synthase A
MALRKSKRLIQCQMQAAIAPKRHYPEFLLQGVIRPTSVWDGPEYRLPLVKTVKGYSDKTTFAVTSAAALSQSKNIKDIPIEHGTMQKFISKLLVAMPQEWLGTTFRNDDKTYHGREGFANNLYALMASKQATEANITEQDLMMVGNAEDYYRVATNVATTLELALASPFQENGMQYIKGNQVFSFGSTKMPFLAVCLTNPDKMVHFYFPQTEEGWETPFSFDADTGIDHEKLLGHLKCRFQVHQNKMPPKEGLPADEIAIVAPTCTSTESLSTLLKSPEVDGVVTPSVLYIRDAQKLKPADMLVIRKRMATPATTSMSEHLLNQFTGKESAKPAFDGVGQAEFFNHLQELSGTDVNVECSPAVFTAGLPCISAIYCALVQGNTLWKGGADVLMCSTAYGGSSQLTDLMDQRAGLLTKHTFDIQGAVPINESIEQALDNLAQKKDELFNTTVLFVEVPTNPDLKVPSLDKIAAALEGYKEKTKKNVLLLVDTTFAPSSKVLKKIKEQSPDLPAMVFMSMSKSMSRGKTTAGCVVANHTAEAIALCKNIEAMGRIFDTHAKPEQMRTLVENHANVEERCLKSYKVALGMGEFLQEAIKKKTGQDMNLAFVSPEEVERGFTSSTFSFNLPSPPGATEAINEAFAQNFVNLLVRDVEHMKPCVSFGQDNGLIYCTVPATSTQGAVKMQDKAKQAVNGVQLVRLSFPVELKDQDKVAQIFQNAVEQVYDAAAEEVAAIKEADKMESWSDFAGYELAHPSVSQMSFGHHFVNLAYCRH